MQIEHKYKVETIPFNFKVIDALDFTEEPTLLLEKDSIGNSFLSYLADSNGDIEQRIYLQVSNDRLQNIFADEVSIRDAYSNPENKYLYITEYFLNTGKASSCYIMPSVEFGKINPIPIDYNIDYEPAINKVDVNNTELLQYSERTQKLVFDFYLQSQNLINSIKPYAIYKVLTPIVEMIKSLVEFDNRNADKILSFSNLRHGSLGVTIEVNYSKDLFLAKENEALETISNLLNAQSKEDFERIISKTTNNKYIKDYKTIIKAIIDNDASLHTAFANPITNRVIKSALNKESALQAKIIIDETFDIIEDIEEIIGNFLEIDIDTKEPSFKIFSIDDDFTIKGKFELSLIEKLKNDLINIGVEKYKFSIKTIYSPETTMNAEQLKRYMINYSKEL